MKINPCNKCKKCICYKKIPNVDGVLEEYCHPGRFFCMPIERVNKKTCKARKTDKAEIDKLLVVKYESKFKEIIHFLEYEIKQAELYKTEEIPMYDGVEVGFDLAPKLQERHIKFCKQILDLIFGKDKQDF